LKRPFTKEHLSRLRAKLQTIGPKTDRLVLKFVAHRFADDKAREYARQGFARRIQTLRRCIENVFRIVAPGAMKVPSKQRLHDAQINIQGAIANTYGCVDNLAWVWVHERGLRKQIKPRQVGLRSHNTQVRASLPADLRAYLDTLEVWFEYLADYRHALAHRIPVYLPPGNVRPKDVDAYNDLERRMTAALNGLRPAEYERLLAEQSKLLVFQPVVGHSLSEMKAPYYFHPQLLADFLTVEELGEKMLFELQRMK
jgi:hypothetical protein